MAAKKGFNQLLEKTLDNLLKEVMDEKKVDEQGKPVYSLTDKTKVIDRVLKWEMVKARMEDSGLGSGFDD